MLRWLGASLLLASPFEGHILGMLLRLRGGQKQSAALLVAVTLSLAAGLSFAGRQVPPIIGGSENQILLPALLVIGLFAGWFDARRTAPS
jgi:hypothetical protein